MSVSPDPKNLPVPVSLDLSLVYDEIDKLRKQQSPLPPPESGLHLRKLRTYADSELTLSHASPSLPALRLGTQERPLPARPVTLSPTTRPRVTITLQPVPRSAYRVLMDSDKSGR